MPRIAWPRYVHQEKTSSRSHDQLEGQRLADSPLWPSLFCTKCYHWAAHRLDQDLGHRTPSTLCMCEAEVEHHVRPVESMIPDKKS